MNFKEIINKYTNDGYNYLAASSKACQDVILSKIAKSSLSQNVTIKGGVVIHNISDDKRRATRDFDFDFIRYSLEDESIQKFICILNDVNDGISIKITSSLEELKHQEYKGKRLTVELTDNEHNKTEIKFDIGVHKRFNIEQDEYCFELSNLSESVQLLVNSKKQIFTEKLTSLLKLGRFSVRYKDLFDFYYFINTAGMDTNKLKNCFAEYIFNAQGMKETSVDEIYERLKSIFRDKNYLKNANSAHNNWLELPINEVTENVLAYIKKL